MNPDVPTVSLGVVSMRLRAFRVTADPLRVRIVVLLLLS